MYVSVRTDVLHSAAAFHWLGKDGIGVFLGDDYEIIICMTGWSNESSSLI